METNELKPCPFCKAEANVISDYGMHGEVFSVYHQCKKTVGRFNRYGSVDRITIDTGWYDTVEEAIEAWNTRAERTCRMEYDKSKRGVYCSHCGERMDVYTWEHHVDGTAGYLYPFCYWCGSKVVE